jgi:hypothetical protein
MSQIKHILFLTNIVVYQIITIFRRDFFHNSVLPENKANCDDITVSDENGYSYNVMLVLQPEYYIQNSVTLNSSSLTY